MTKRKRSFMVLILFLFSLSFYVFFICNAPKSKEFGKGESFPREKIKEEDTYHIFKGKINEKNLSLDMIFNNDDFYKKLSVSTKNGKIVYYVKINQLPNKPSLVKIITQEGEVITSGERLTKRQEEYDKYSESISKNQMGRMKKITN